MIFPKFSPYIVFSAPRRFTTNVCIPNSQALLMCKGSVWFLEGSKRHCMVTVCIYLYPVFSYRGCETATDLHSWSMIQVLHNDPGCPRLPHLSLCRSNLLPHEVFLQTIEKNSRERFITCPFHPSTSRQTDYSFSLNIYLRV